MLEMSAQMACEDPLALSERLCAVAGSARVSSFWFASLRRRRLALRQAQGLSSVAATGTTRHREDCAGALL